MVYPLLLDKEIDKAKLFKENIFIPTFWNEVLERGDIENSYGYEKKMTQRLLPLPIDQRYGIKDMNKIVKNIIKK